MSTTVFDKIKPKYIDGTKPCRPVQLKYKFPCDMIKGFSDEIEFKKKG